MDTLLFSRKKKLIAFIFVGELLSGSAWADYYTITDIGAFAGGYSSAVAINNSGQVTGTSNHAISSYAPFIYSNGTMTDIGIYRPNGDSLGFGTHAINNSGTVAGASVWPLAGQRATTFDGVAYSNLGVLAYDFGSLDSPYSSAYGINDQGQVVGVASARDSRIVNNTTHAFLYADNQMTDLGTLGGLYSEARDINNNGQVVGVAETGAFQSHAFLYSGGLMLDIGTLGGGGSVALAINDNGQIVGSSSIAGNSGAHPFLYSEGVMTDLGSLYGFSATATAINNNGLVVGTASLDQYGSSTHAFVYMDGKLLDLNTLIDPSLGWNLYEATGVNDLGQIVGNGDIGGKSRGFILNVSSVPVPAAAWMFGSCLLGLTGLARKRKQIKR